jgi:predicted pPIWI-associating nuclease
MMSDAFNTANFALAKVQRDMEKINRLINPSFLRNIEQLERRMELAHRQHLEVRRILEMSGVASMVENIIGANQHWQDMLKQAAAASRIVEDLSAAHQSWFELISSTKHDIPQLQASAKLVLCDISLQLTASEQLMAGIDFEVVRSRFQITKPIVSGLERSLGHVATSYGSLAKSLQGISDITHQPAFVLPGATREIYTTSVALATFSTGKERSEDSAETEKHLVSEVKQATPSIIDFLKQVDHELVRPYIGARDALQSNNADRTRHFLSSLRELWNHLLRRLSPDKIITEWIQVNDKQNDLLHDGKPTRRSRILYICRELNNDPLTEFLIHDTRSFVKLLELFNRVHELNSELTDEQLRAILLKTDSWLMYILQISMGYSHK